VVVLGWRRRDRTTSKHNKSGIILSIYIYIIFTTQSISVYIYYAVSFVVVHPAVKAYLEVHFELSSSC